MGGLMMNIPKYILGLLERSKYTYKDGYAKNEYYAVGYTIEIHKRTYYSRVETLKEEIEKLEKFVTKNNSELKILYIPTETHYNDQYAVITIFDPIMKQLEQYIK
jgi:hypothetical protein